MRAIARVTLVLVLIGVLGATTGAKASCGGPATEADALSRADVVFEGVASDGPIYGGQLADPIRFRVVEVIKGDSSAKEFLVNGGSQLVAGGLQTSSVALVVQAGEVWRIYASKYGLELLTSNCSGSRLLGHVSKQAFAIPEPRYHSIAILGLFVGLVVTMIGGYLVGRRLSSSS